MHATVADQVEQTNGAAACGRAHRERPEARITLQSAGTASIAPRARRAIRPDARVARFNLSRQFKGWAGRPLATCICQVCVQPHIQFVISGDHRTGQARDDKEGRNQQEKQRACCPQNWKADESRKVRGAPTSSVPKPADA